METYISEIYQRFDLTPNGFLPLKPIRPLKSNLEWELVMTTLSDKKSEPGFRNNIESLPDFNLTTLTKQKHYRRAYLVLSMLANVYVLGHQPISQSIPKKIAQPLCLVSEYLGINPIMTHAALDLYNWDLIDESKHIELDNLKNINLITGTEDEEHFYLVMTAIEKVGGSIINHILKILFEFSNEKEKSIELIRDQLVNINLDLQVIISIIRRMPEKCRPEVFFNVLRPFLKGWDKNEDIPNGMTYEGVSTEPKFYCGESAAQSSLFQVLDSALNINHQNSYFDSIQNYMPGKHREFVNYIKQNINLEAISKQLNLDSEYKECIKSLVLFRSIHLSIVHKYILQQVQNHNQNVDTHKILGTGGTPLVEFLNETITESNKNRF